MKKIYFDESLPKFASFIYKSLGQNYLEKNFFLRDAFGKLSFVLIDCNINTEKRTKLAKKVEKILLDYVDHDGFAITTPDELFDDKLNDLSIAKKTYISTEDFSGFIFLYERRLIGSDWFKVPTASSFPSPAKIVFSSIKGGVGRSTALCVAAAALSSEGKRILAIDMDLEAPGLGSMLLNDDVLPAFGLLDFFVEKNIYDLDNDFFLDIVGPSWISKGRGRVDVVPALGKKSLENPQNVLSKIARAYLSTEIKGITKTFTDYMHDFIERFSITNRYDAILIDARSGLHETTASAMVGLEAEILCFGLDEPQTLPGYDLLFSHLSTLPELDSSWLSRLHFVQAKAPEKRASRERFSQIIEARIARYFVEAKPEEDFDVSTLKDTFEIEWENEENTDLFDEDELLDIDEKINPVIAILDDKRFQNFDPLSDSDSLSKSVYNVTFGSLLDKVRTIVNDSLDNGEI